MFIKSFAEGEFVDKEEQEMAKFEYSVLRIDTLSLESFEFRILILRKGRTFAYFIFIKTNHKCIQGDRSLSQR